MKLLNKLVVITGAGSGIGRQLALGALARGAAVAALDRNPALLSKTAELADAGDRLQTFELDVADRAGAAAAPARIAERFGREADGLVNNAGVIQPFVRIADLPMETIDRVMEVNLFGTIRLTKAFLPVLLARPEAHIACVSSMGGFLPVPGQSAYGSAKAGVKLFTEALACELKGTNVGVSVVFPGAIATDITANSGVDAPKVEPEAGKKQREYKLTSAADAAKIILDGIEANRLRILVGQDAKFMDAIYRISPERAAAFITKQMANLLPGDARQPTRTPADRSLRTSA
ncbi:putative oxidoreductase [Hyaloraphidium curvatum]|nr:putative oxidoreductase [Hyaloraphidium curvatum]